MERKKKRQQQPIILTREQKNAQAEIDKEDGKWFRDISKFILTAILITSIFEGIQNKWIAYPVGLAAVAVTYLWGTRLFNNYKKNKENGTDNWEQHGNTNGDRRHDQSLPQREERKTTGTRVETTTNNENKMTEEKNYRKQHGSIHGRRRQGQKRKK